MEKLRTIKRPPTEGTNVTLAEARAALLELYRESRASAKKKVAPRHKRTAKGG